MPKPEEPAAGARADTTRSLSARLELPLSGSSRTRRLPPRSVSFRGQSRQQILTHPITRPQRVCILQKSPAANPLLQAARLPRPPPHTREDRHHPLWRYPNTFSVKEAEVEKGILLRLAAHEQARVPQLAKTCRCVEELGQAAQGHRPQVHMKPPALQYHNGR